MSAAVVPALVEGPGRPAPRVTKRSRIRLVFLALCVSTLLSALDLTAVAIILPAVAKEFKTSEYNWIGSAYALSSTAVIPWTGGLAAIFGRRAAMLASLLLFAVGSAVSGAAPNMHALIIGRSIQGVGGGGILTMTQIVVVDIIPLTERGLYMGCIGAIWAFASAIGPPVGGALANGGQWRWLFYLNLPITAIAVILVAAFLDVKVPQTTWRQKAAQMDYVNLLFVAASTSAILALTWAGTTYSWASYKVLVPLILGLAGMGLFIYIERVWVKHPTVPFDILTHRTALIGFLTNFIIGIVSLAAIYYLPIYFQSAKDASPIRAGTDMFSLSFTIAPLAILTGASVAITKHYKLQNVAGWILVLIGLGTSSTIKWNSSMPATIGFPVILGIGLGMPWTGIMFCVVAPLSPKQHPPAMAFFEFTRAFGQVFGIAIGGTILQNQLYAKLPAAFTEQLGPDLYAAIPLIRTLAEPLRTEVRTAFAESLATIWQVMIGIAGVAFVASLFLQNLVLVDETDGDWGLTDGPPKDASLQDDEKC